MAAQNTTNQADPRIDIGNAYTPRRPAPIIGISINHPIATLARKIKNFLIHKQTLFSTTFSIKVTPIVAMVSLLGVVALFGGGMTTAYNFGKTVEQKFIASTPSPTPKVVMQTPIITIVSKTGTIKSTYQIPSVSLNGTPISATPTVIPTLSLVIPGSDQGSMDSRLRGNDSISSVPTASPLPPPILHYILVSRSGSILYLASTIVHLQNYLGLRVLITGSFDSTKNTLTITKPEDIEVLQ